LLPTKHTISENFLIKQFKLNKVLNLICNDFSTEWLHLSLPG